MAWQQMGRVASTVEERWLEEGFESICDLANAFDSEADLQGVLQGWSIAETDAQDAVAVWRRARTQSAKLISEFVETVPLDRPCTASTPKSEVVSTSSKSIGAVPLVGPLAVPRLKRSSIQVVALPSKHPKWHHRRKARHALF